MKLKMFGVNQNNNKKQKQKLIFSKMTSINYIKMLFSKMSLEI